jgi:hypothetical protein
MKNEIKNDTHHQNTVEQNQENGTAGQSGATTPATAAYAPTASSVEPETRNSEPATQHQSPETRDSAPHCAPNPEGEAPSAPVQPLPGTVALQATITLNRAQGRPSKVSQLPPELIAFVNEELLRRVPYRIIAGQLAEKGYPGFTQDNLSTWKLGPFSKWAQEQQTFDQQNRQRELALDYARTHGTSLLDTLEEIHAHNLYETALGLNPSGIVGKFRETPELFLRVNREISAFVRICREKKPRAAALGKKLETPHSSGWEREKKGGLTIEERDIVRAGLGIRPPPPQPKPEPGAQEPEAKPESTPPPQ